MTIQQDWIGWPDAQVRDFIAATWPGELGGRAEWIHAAVALSGASMFAREVIPNTRHAAELDLLSAIAFHNSTWE